MTQAIDLRRFVVPRPAERDGVCKARKEDLCHVISVASHCTGHQILLAMTFVLLLLFSLAQPQPYNVLFIAVDDLRAQLNIYGNEYMVTPNLDRLAEEGILFNHHYVQVATCGASRYSLLTGQRPTPSRMATFGNGAADAMSNGNDTTMTLPRLFRENGYRTVSIGKISHSPDGHMYAYSGSGDGRPEMPGSWDEAGLPYGAWEYGWGAFFGYAGGKSREGPNAIDPAPVAEGADVPDTGYPDGLIAEEAIQKLSELKDSSFFLAVGFFKPHLPFTAPKSYWDLYDRDSIPLTEYPNRPENTSTTFTTSSTEINRYLTEGSTSEERSRLRRHGYFACVSYVDAQVGKVLHALDSLSLKENTIVVVWGDHGWHLGDLSFWGKHNANEFGNRSTLIMDVPGTPSGISDGPVESVDIFPTLAELCELNIPETVDGTSFAHLLPAPEQIAKDGAFSYWRRSGHIGTALRTDRYRLILWFSETDSSIGQIELYDHETDPGETVNIAADKPDIVDSLSELLYAHNPVYPKEVSIDHRRSAAHDSPVHSGTDRLLVSLFPHSTIQLPDRCTGLSLYTTKGRKVWEADVQKLYSGAMQVPAAVKAGLYAIKFISQ